MRYHIRARNARQSAYCPVCAKKTIDLDMAADDMPGDGQSVPVNILCCSQSCRVTYQGRIKEKVAGDTSIWAQLSVEYGILLGDF